MSLKYEVSRYDLEGCSIAVEMCETAFKGDREHMKRLLANKVPQFSMPGCLVKCIEI